MTARTRLGLCLAVGLAASIPAIILTPWQVAELVGWDASAAAFIASVYLTTRGKDPAKTRAMATREDDSRFAAELILVCSCLASLVGVGLALLRAANERGPAHILTIGLAFLSVVLSWASIHTVFTLHYARVYHREGGGINWHSHEPPDYGDFAYLALTLGMTFQVSDTDINSRAIRKLVIRHALLSYLFGVVVLATLINVIASLLSG
ncbi:MAG: DUF1345 domain-containing protein [Candidatus Dormiibacterota bacterium]